MTGFRDNTESDWAAQVARDLKDLPGYGFIYAISHGADRLEGPYKVGMTTDIARRFRSYNNAMCGEVQLIAVGKPASASTSQELREVERAVHNLIPVCASALEAELGTPFQVRRQGEWFYSRLEPVIAAMAARNVCDLYGLPLLPGNTVQGQSADVGGWPCL